VVAEASRLTAAPTLVALQPVAARSVRRQPDLVAWLCEALGTALMLFLGFCSVAVINATGSPLRPQLPSAGLRYALIGAGFGLAVAAIVVSPLGRRSGAHLNPAVTLAFWWRGRTRGLDAIGYVVAQCVGGTAAAAAFAAVWGPWSEQIRGGRTVPAAGVSHLEATGIEALLTFGLVIAILAILAAPRLARWVPTVIAAVITVLIWAGAGSTGASFNPARTLGPALVQGDFTAFWVYVVGPMLGSALAVVLFSAAEAWRPASLSWPRPGRTPWG
jgi:aquaporin Z